jgi:hypothetical protein
MGGGEAPPEAQRPGLTALAADTLIDPRTGMNGRTA